MYNIHSSQLNFRLYRELISTKFKKTKIALNASEKLLVETYLFDICAHVERYDSI